MISDALPDVIHGIQHVERFSDLGIPQEKFTGPLSLNHLRFPYHVHKEDGPCAIPSCGVRHQRGWVAVMSCGTVVLVGKDCCKSKFGAPWDKEIRRWTENSNRATAIAAINRVAAAAPQALELAERLHAGLKPLKPLAHDLERVLGVEHWQLARAMRAEGGKLMVYEQFSGSGRELAGKNMGRATVFAALPGTAFFSERQFAGAVSKAKDAIEEAARAADPDGLDGRGTPYLRDLARRAVRSIDKLVDLAGVGEAANEFFTTANFETVVGWINARYRSLTRYHVSSGRLTTDGMDRVAPITAPFDFASLKRELQILRVAADGKVRDSAAA